MTTKQEWLALAERCEKATGPDREIDGAILIALGYYHHGNGALGPHWNKRGTGIWHEGRLTASLDAINALIERELPGLWRQSAEFPGCEIKASAYLYVPGTPTLVGYYAKAETEILARCAAFCRAMAGKAGE